MEKEDRQEETKDKEINKKIAAARKTKTGSKMVINDE